MANPQPIPDAVKRQALSAVGHSDVMAMTRRMNAHYAGFERADNDPPTGPSRPLTDEVKQKALSAVGHPSVREHVRMLEDTGSVRPPHTPSTRSRYMGEHVSNLYRTGRDAHEMHQKVTQNHFGREYV